MLTVDFCSSENNEHTTRTAQTPHTAEADMQVASRSCERGPAEFSQARSFSTEGSVLTPPPRPPVALALPQPVRTLDTSCCDAVPHAFWIRMALGDRWWSDL